MKENEMSVAIEGKTLVVRIGMKDKLERSKSGLTFIVASSHGPQKTEVQVNGQVVTVGLNAYIK